ncbi:MAG TPA: type II toxin-antitoxin system VapB family antitoxin [Anditalea sp.]|nr:type II toxin-antitoxin system VapB family antitoxin [Anditalea sp.]
MKITAIVPDEMIREAMRYSEADTVTETLKTALTAFIANKKLKELGSHVMEEPLQFKYSAKTIREKNNL